MPAASNVYRNEFEFRESDSGRSRTFSPYLIFYTHVNPLGLQGLLQILVLFYVVHLRYGCAR